MHADCAFYYYGTTALSHNFSLSFILLHKSLLLLLFYFAACPLLLLLLLLLASFSSSLVLHDAQVPGAAHSAVFKICLSSLIMRPAFACVGLRCLSHVCASNAGSLRGNRMFSLPVLRRAHVHGLASSMLAAKQHKKGTVDLGIRAKEILRVAQGIATKSLLCQ